ncbi:MAG: hypothetical protein EOP86_07615 [Verrucomicrobiaceae bacterium]|nr:MAG: hypothetical protein EOP86_07615 [Verrucomicrobiaceae bacterium]
MNHDDRSNPYSEANPYASYSNPYAVPESEIVVPAQTEGARIEKKCLVVPKDWMSSPVCLLTGSVTNLITPPRSRKLTWVNPVWILLFFLIGLFALLPMLLLQKKGRFSYYLSGPAAFGLKKKLAINWGIFGTGLVIVVLALSPATTGLTPELLLTGTALILLSAILATTWCRPFYARKIDQTHIWIAKIPAHVREAIVEMEKTAALRPWM